jgi:hypothetical protein
MSRATAIGFIAVALAMLATGCSNDNPAAPNSPDNDVTTKTAAGGLASDPGPPAEGIVVEGASVPGIALGFTRAEVEEVYGEGTGCEGTGSPCGWDVPGGGEVHVSFRGPHGGEASGSPDDVAVYAHWSEAVDGWTTTAGVNTTLADEDPEALVAAYPNARVTRNQWGGVITVTDYSLGIQFRRDWILYSSGEVIVTGSIFYPREPPPLPEQITYVYTIDLTAMKNKGKRRIRAFVGVRNETQLAAKGATVFARWTFPDGSTPAAESTTSLSGYAYLEINDIPRGTYTLTVEDVVLADRRFDSANSVLSASVKVK